MRTALRRASSSRGNQGFGWGSTPSSGQPSVKALVAACLFAPVLRAQDGNVDADGDPVYAYQGPAYFGFVKDTDGASVPDAGVMLARRAASR